MAPSTKQQTKHSKIELLPVRALPRRQGFSLKQLSVLSAKLLEDHVGALLPDNPVQTETLSILSKADHYNNWIMSQISPHLSGKVLEVGCGTGNFSQKFLDHPKVSSVMAVDVVDGYAEKASEKTIVPEGKAFNAQTLDIFEKDTASPFQAESFDTVVLLNVLEHIEDHQQAIKTLKRYLKPGGKIIILVPAQQWLMSDYDVAIGHFRRYSQITIEALLWKYELNVVENKNFNVFGIMGWIWNFKVRRKQVFNNAHVGLFNAMVPALKWLEDRVSMPVGLSVFAVAEK